VVDDWDQLGQNIEGETAAEFFGSAVSLNSDGSILAVGAFDWNATKGRVRVYQISAESRWLQLGSDLYGLEQGDAFGRSVALSADGFMLVVGAPEHDFDGLVSSGEVSVYRYSNSSWNQVGDRLHGEFKGDSFGVDVRTI